MYCLTGRTEGNTLYISLLEINILKNERDLAKTSLNENSVNLIPPEFWFDLYLR